MARSMFRFVVEDRVGGLIQNAQVQLFRPATSTRVYGNLWDAPVGGAQVTNPLITNDHGEARAWLDVHQRIDVRINDGGGVAYYPGDPGNPITFTAYRVSDVELPPPVEASPPLFNATAYGVTAQSGTDDGPAMQNALDDASGGMLVLPRGTIRSSIPLHTGASGSGIMGQGIGNGGTIITPTAGAGLPRILDIPDTLAHISNVRFEGGGDAGKGILFHGGWHSYLEHVTVRGVTGDGVVLDNVPGGSLVGGANNEITFNSCHFENNGQNGFSIGPDSIDQHDNDNCVFTNCTATGNGANGLLLCGVGFKVIGGNYLQNGIGAGGYGIQVGRAGDAHVSRAAYLLAPWVEGNGNGAADHGVAFPNAFGCVFFHQYGQDTPPQQGVDWSVSDRSNVDIQTNVNGNYQFSNVVDATAAGVATFISSFSPPRDSEFPGNAPPNGTMAIGADGKIYRRKGGSWGLGS